MFQYLSTLISPPFCSYIIALNGEAKEGGREVEETKIETNGIWRGSIRATTPEGTQTFMSDGNRNYTATFFCKSNAVKLELDSIEGDLTLSVRGIKDRA